MSTAFNTVTAGAANSFGIRNGLYYGALGLPLAFVALPLYVILPNHYAREFGVPHLVATEPETRGDAFTGKPSGIPCFREGKVARLEQWLAAIGRPLASFAASSFYSDSHNDLPLLERVTRPVAVDPDDALRRTAESRGWPVISLR